MNGFIEWNDEQESDFEDEESLYAQPYLGASTEEQVRVDRHSPLAQAAGSCTARRRGNQVTLPSVSCFCSGRMIKMRGDGESE